MLLLEGAEGPEMMHALKKVFAVYGVFWIGVIVILYFAVGFLISRAERAKKH
jgi:hypothetical protein